MFTEGMQASCCDDEGCQAGRPATSVARGIVRERPLMPSVMVLDQGAMSTSSAR